MEEQGYFLRSSLENYTSNNTRQHDTTQVQHDITRVQHETTRVQYDHGTIIGELLYFHDTTQHEYNTTQHE